MKGFYPDSADTFMKAHTEPKECPCDVPPPSVADCFGVVRHCNGLDGQLLRVLGGRQPAQ
jgi:hypothetical protein